MNRVITLIDSRDDPRIRPYLDLRHANADRTLSHFIAEGRWVVERLVASDFDIDSVLVQRGREDMLPADLPSSVPVFVAERTLMQQLVGFEFHRGILACGVRRELASTERIVSNQEAPTVIPALMNVTCPENVGSVLRTSAALGIDQIVLGPGTLDHLSRRVIRVSMGSAFTHRFYIMRDPLDELARLRDQLGFRVIATTLGDGAVDINRYKAESDRSIVLIGNEATGLTAEIESVATERLTIPMKQGVDSLNVAVASAIFLHELTRPRRQ